MSILPLLASKGPAGGGHKFNGVGDLRGGGQLRREKGQTLRAPRPRCGPESRWGQRVDDVPTKKRYGPGLGGLSSPLSATSSWSPPLTATPGANISSLWASPTWAPHWVRLADSWLVRSETVPAAQPGKVPGGATRTIFPLSLSSDRPGEVVNFAV